MTEKIRFRFEKGSQVCFLSHLDLLRTMERALRRAELPIAFSKGFSPKPKMSFSPPLAVGLLSIAEYGDFEFQADLAEEDFVVRFNKELPAGLEVLQARILPPGSAALMTVISAAEYELVLPDCEPESLRDRRDQVWARDTFIFKRQTKKGLRECNIRPFLLENPVVQRKGRDVLLHCRCAVGSGGNLRMDELGAMLGFEYRQAQITRTALLIKEGADYRQPLES